MEEEERNETVSRKVISGEILLDEAIDIIDWGPYQLHLLCLIGTCTACDSMEVGLIAFLQECVKEEWHLDTNQEAMLSSSILVGQIFGILSASMADTFGRRPVVVGGLWCVIVFGFASAFAPDFTSLLILRAVAGYGIGVSQCVSYDLCCEILPSRYRNLIMFCDMVGVAAQLYLVVSLYFLLEAYGWRSILFACAIPVLVVGILSIWIFLESPRWLMTQGRKAEALEVLLHIAEYNSHSCSDGSTYDFQNIAIKYVYDEDEDNKAGYLELLTSAESPRTVLLWTVWFFAYFGFFGILFCLIALQQNKEAETCSYDYQNIVISGSVDILMLFATMYVVDILGRTITQSSLYSISATFTLTWAIVREENASNVLLMTILLVVAKAVYVGGMEAMWLHTMELFPTWLRATGHTSCVVIGRIGAICSTFWVDSFSPSYPLPGGLGLAFALSVAAVGVLFLQETTGKNLDENENKSTVHEDAETAGERKRLLGDDVVDDVFVENTENSIDAGRSKTE